MKIREIRNELQKIYRERKSWNGAEGPFTKQTIRQRELILIKQQILYQIEDAKLLRDKYGESLSYALYQLINDYLNNTCFQN